MIAFWTLAPFMVVAALGLIFARKAVHAALCLAFVMISLAVLYAAQGATFLFAVQIIVYTGAIMMLFLFVLMLVGVETKESVVELIRGQRAASAVVGIAFGAIVTLAIGQTVSTTVVGLDAANQHGNVHGLATLLFSDYVVAFQFTAALMIVAVLGAMVLAHQMRLKDPLTQQDLQRQRMVDYAEHGAHPGNAPTPGVYALHNAVDMPALLPDGSPVESSVANVLRARQQDLEARGTGDVERILDDIEHEDLGVGVGDEAPEAEATTPEEEA